MSKAGHTETMVLNGWAASPSAWNLCDFAHEARIFSYIEQLDGAADGFVRGFDGRIVVAAWSMGCVTALRIAAEQPGKIKGLVLAAATPRLMEDRETGWRGMTELRLQALRKGLEITGGKGLFARDPSWPDPYIPDTPDNLERGLGFLRSADVRALVDSIPRSMPVHIFQSERDGVSRASGARWLAERLPGAELYIVPGTEHALPLSLHSEISASVRLLAGL